MITARSSSVTLTSQHPDILTISTAKPQGDRQGLELSALGLGCMGMSEFYGSTNENEAIATIHRALELATDFLDTADVYGPCRNKKLVGRVSRDRRDRVITIFETIAKPIPTPGPNAASVWGKALAGGAVSTRARRYAWPDGARGQTVTCGASWRSMPRPFRGSYFAMAKLHYMIGASGS